MKAHGGTVMQEHDLTLPHAIVLHLVLSQGSDSLADAYSAQPHQRNGEITQETPSHPRQASAPVSYTHLDVYKRQVQHLIVGITSAQDRHGIGDDCQVDTDIGTVERKVAVGCGDLRAVGLSLIHI